ncbi:MAG: hypothetical protein HQK54_07820 [Oligoflexales bacterium]|nr:hypothetical protein [Oligoflexales bacterium]
MTISVNKSLLQPLKLDTSIGRDIDISVHREDDGGPGFETVPYEEPRDKEIREFIRPGISERTRQIDHDTHSDMVKKWFQGEKIKGLSPEARKKVEDGLAILRQAESDRFISQTMRRLLIKA